MQLTRPFKFQVSCNIRNQFLHNPRPLNNHGSSSRASLRSLHVSPTSPLPLKPALPQSHLSLMSSHLQSHLNLTFSLLQPQKQVLETPTKLDSNKPIEAYFTKSTSLPRMMQ